MRSGVNFTNILWAAFMWKDPKSVKIQSSHQYLFGLLGSVNVEALSKMLMKFTPKLYVGSVYLQELVANYVLNDCKSQLKKIIRGAYKFDRQPV